MARFPTRNRSTPRPPRAIVLAIGQRVFVNCPGNRAGTVPLEDESGKVRSAVHLADGAEVEVVAWQPRGATDTRYRVRRRSDGADGWLSCENLRTTLAVVSAPPAELVNGDADDARPFGQRAHTGQTSVVRSEPTVGPSAVDDSRRRRFGQHF